jgi:hypothetical protein
LVVKENVQVEQMPINFELAFWDTYASDSDHFAKSRRKLYIYAHVVLLNFAVDDFASFENVLHHVCPI